MPTHPGHGLRTFSSSFLEDLFPSEMQRRGRRARTNGSAAGFDRTGRGRRSPALAVNGDPSPAERRRQLLAEREQLAVDPSEFQRPTFDKERSRINKIVTGVGAVGGLVAALGGSEIGAAAGAGLAQGGAQNLQQQRESFRRRKSAFAEQLANARQFNRQLALSTSEARVRGAEAAQERQFEREQTRRERQFEREQGETEREFEERLVQLRDRLEDEMAPKEKEALDALIEQRRASAEASRGLADFRRRRDAPSETEEEDELSSLTTSQLKSLLSRGRNMLETGLPAGMEPTEQNRLAATTGGELPSQTDISRVAERVSRIQRILQERGELNGQAGGGGPQPGPQFEDVESVFNQPAPQNGQPQQRQQEERREQPADVSGEVTGELRDRVLDQIPSDVNIEVALNAAALVRSDTTSFTPAQFERAFGFNPFE